MKEFSVSQLKLFQFFLAQDSDLPGSIDFDLQLRKMFRLAEVSFLSVCRHFSPAQIFFSGFAENESE